MKLKFKTMKKIASLPLLFICLTSFIIKSDNCDNLLFFKEGSSTTMTSYKAKGEITGSVKTLFKQVSKTGDGVIVAATQESYDKKGKLSNTNDFSIKCENNILYFDAKNLMPSQQSEAYKDFEMTVEGMDMELPNNLSVGDNLKDADVKFNFKSKSGQEMPMMNVAIKIFDRKVEAIETITTPAGTFECYKITEQTEVKTMIGFTSKSISWFNKEVGTVRTESYNKNDKFMGYTELTEVTK